MIIAEYIEREALKQNIRIMPRTTHPELVLYSSVQKIISNEPTADVVKVVRCKDCKHCEHINDEFNKDWYQCKRRGNSFQRKPNDFCSYGELKECEGK
jgi:hypothetical protein